MIRLPLYSKILLWFFLNLLVLGVAIYALFSAQFRVGPDWLLSSGVTERLQAVARVLTEDLNARPRSEWDEILRRFSTAHRVQFLVFRNDGEQLAGEPTPLPPPVQQRLMMPGNPRREFGPPEGADEEPFPPRRRGPRPLRDSPDFRGPPRGPQDRPLPGRLPFMVKTDDPRRYWIGLRLPIRDPALDRQPPATLIGHGQIAARWIARGFDIVDVGRRRRVRFLGFVLAAVRSQHHAITRDK
jgi:two-component system sensor histidine kinase CpxA